jgi:hypothetical protein
MAALSVRRLLIKQANGTQQLRGDMQSWPPVANRGLAMKMLQIVPSDRTRLYAAMIKKQADIRRSGRGTFSRAGAQRRGGVKWTHVRYKGSINLQPSGSEAVEAVIRSPDRGDDARLLSSFLGWLDRHFGEHLASVDIKYRRA